MQTLENPTAIASIETSPEFDTTIHRRKTRPVKVGNVTIGGGHPVVVQSMINEDTLDIDGSVAGIRRLHEIGCEIVRVTVPSMAHAKALADIKEKYAYSDEYLKMYNALRKTGKKDIESLSLVYLQKTFIQSMIKLK